MRTGSSCRGSRQHDRRLTVAASPEAKAEAAGAAADDVDGTVPTVEAAVTGAPLTVEVALLLPVGGTAPAVEAAAASAPLTGDVTPDVGDTVTGENGTAVGTGAATVVAAVATGTALVNVPETTETALLLTASATTLTNEPVSLVSSEMLVSPSEPKSTVWVELTKRIC